MTDWNGIPPNPSKKAFHWLEDLSGEEIPCLWFPCGEVPEDGYWRLWGEFYVRAPTDVAYSYKYVAEVMTTEKAGKLAEMIIVDLKLAATGIL